MVTAAPNSYILSSVCEQTMKSAVQTATGHSANYMNSHTRKRQKCNIASVLSLVSACAYRVSTFPHNPRVRFNEKRETFHRSRSRFGCRARCFSRNVIKRNNGMIVYTSQGKARIRSVGPFCCMMQ